MIICKNFNYDSTTQSHSYIAAVCQCRFTDLQTIDLHLYVHLQICRPYFWLFSCVYIPPTHPADSASNQCPPLGLCMILSGLKVLVHILLRYHCSRRGRGDPLVRKSLDLGLGCPRASFYKTQFPFHKTKYS